jgi:nitrogen fixation/metabolism regulation signal transduction histidine kinase
VVVSAIADHLHAGAGTTAPVEVELEVEGTLRNVEVTVRPLAGGGHVVAMDDLTQLVRAQRQAAWSEVARRIAHEIKNPLTPIRLAAERIQRRTSQLDGELREIVGESCAAIIAHVTDLKTLVDAFHEYARMPAVSPRGADVVQLLQEVVALYGGLRDGLEVRIERPVGPLAAVVDPTLLRLALVNLVDNAVEALPEGGRVVVRASSADHRSLVLEVEDDGVGLPTDDATLLVQPFYSTKGRGSGMGLALVQRIVVDHGGSLELERRQPRGTRARIVLPGALIEPAR